MTEEGKTTIFWNKVDKNNLLNDVKRRKVDNDGGGGDDDDAILISDNSAVSVLASILKQPVPSLPLLSTLNLTTVTLSTSIFLSAK